MFQNILKLVKIHIPKEINVTRINETAEIGKHSEEEILGAFSSSISNVYFFRLIRKSFSTKVETKRSSEIQKFKLKMIGTCLALWKTGNK